MGWFCTMCLYLQWCQHIPKRCLFSLSRTVNVLIWANGNLFLWKPAWDKNKSCNLLVSILSILLKLLRCPFVESLQIQSLWDQFIHGWENKDAVKIFSWFFSKRTKMPIALIEMLTQLPWGKDCARAACLSIPWGFFVEPIRELHFPIPFSLIPKKHFWKYKKKLSVFQFLDSVDTETENTLNLSFISISQFICHWGVTKNVYLHNILYLIVAYITMIKIYQFGVFFTLEK